MCWAASTSYSPPAASANPIAATAPSPVRVTVRVAASTGINAISCPATATSPIPRTGNPCGGYGTDACQCNGQGGLEHGHKCDQLPGNRDITNPAHRQYIADVWGIPEPEMPGKGLTAYELIEAIHRGEVKGLLSIC